jgi:hypothetical protein
MKLWGRAQNYRKIKIMGIKTVFDFKMANARQLSKIFSVNVERIMIVGYQFDYKFIS